MSGDLEGEIFSALVNDSGPNLSASQLTEKLGCTFDEAHSAAVVPGHRTTGERRTVMIWDQRDTSNRLVDFYVSISDGSAD